MNSKILRRVGIAAIAILVALLIAAIVNLSRFSAASWLSGRLPISSDAFAAEEINSQRFGTNIVLNDVEYDDGELYFTASSVQVKFNLLSVLMGEPTFEQLSLHSPFLETKSAQKPVDQLRAFLQLEPLTVDVTDGLIVNADTEIQDIQLSMFAGGVFGDYELQSFLTFANGTTEATLGLSTTLSFNKDLDISLSKATFDSRMNLPQWRGRLEGSVRKLKLDAANELSLDFLTWTSSWQDTTGNVPYSIDWALGLQSAHIKQDHWQLDTFDSALAYRDSDNHGHTFAVQSGSAELTDGQFSGQLGLSILAEYAPGHPFQTLNLVMSGNIEPGQALSQWQNPQVRLATISADGAPASHNFTMQEIALTLDQQSWLMHDGDWQLIQGDVPAADFGFGDLAGSWPAMQLTEAPDIARRRVQPTLDLLSTETEFLDALYRQLVH